MTNEYVDDRSTAKWTRFNRDQLSDGAKAVADQLGLSAPCHNPFMNSVAQVVECVFSVEKTIEHSQWLLDNGIKEEGLGSNFAHHCFLNIECRTGNVE